MNSSKGLPSGQVAQSSSITDFERSNSTTAAFLGGKQKEWMAGGIAPVALKKSLRPNLSNSRPLLQAAGSSPDLAVTIESPNSIKKYDYSVQPFPPDYDRGRFPLHRRRRGGTKNYPSRQADLSASVAPPPVPQPPMAEIKPLVAAAKCGNGNASNVLPSPSPSIETRRQSCNIIDLEDESVEPQPAGSDFMTRLEELVAQHGGLDVVEKKLQEAERPSTVSAERAQNPTLGSGVQGNDCARTSISVESPDQDNNQIVPPFVAHNVSRAASAMSKRPSENAQEPRKRLQSLPESILTTSSPTFGPSGRPNMGGVQNPDRQIQQFEAEMRNFHEMASLHTFQYNMGTRPVDTTEDRRLGLLRAACKQSDCFYLCLHQLYCLHSMPKEQGDILAQDYSDGLEKLAGLLLPNNTLSPDAIKWFSDFPKPLKSLLSNNPVFQSARDRALNFLMRLGRNSDIMLEKCINRGYPPLVDELIVLFGTESFITQHVIFRALLRSMWKGAQDQCFQRVEEMFPKSYKEIMLSKSVNPSVEASTAHYQAFINAYRELAVFHQQHMRTIPTQQNQRSLLPRSQTEPGHGQGSSSRIDTRTAQGTTHSFPTPTMPTSVAVPQAAPTNGPGFPMRQGYSPPQVLATNRFPAPQGAKHTRPPMPVTAGHNQNLPRNVISDGQNQPRRTDHRRQSDPHLTSTFPSEIVGRVTQSIPQSFEMRQTLPSNVPNQSQRGSQQNARSGPQHLTQSQPPAPYPHSNPPSQPGPRHEVHRHSFQLVPETQTTPSTSTQFIRANPNLNQIQAEPARYALHQAHVRSPILSSLTIHEKRKLFRYIRHVFLPTGELSNVKRHASWKFRIDKVVLDSLARDTPGSHGSQSVRMLHPGTRICRIRCITIVQAHGLPTQSDWVVADNVWPGSTAIILNGDALEIRKKTHHGKDLPVDATPYIREGENDISTAIIGLPEGGNTRYAIGVEIVEVIDEQFLKTRLPILPLQDARKRIIDRSRNIDPDVQVVHSQMVLDLTDPFMARIFDVPVRGASCRHNQCFDRDVFLQTRNTKNPKEPCGPDEFRCPICGLDARPQSLLIDGFFVSIREELQRRGRLDVKSVTLHPSGDWEVREEEEATGEQGDGSGIRKARARRSVGRQSVPQDVIDLGD